MSASLDDGLSVFANWQTLALGLTIYVMTAAIRRIVETGWKGATQSKWWYEVLLPLGPIGNGIILALTLKQFPWPPAVAESTSARVMYAIVCGLFCGWLYARVRGFFRQGQAQGPDNGSNLIPSLSANPTPADDKLSQVAEAAAKLAEKAEKVSEKAEKIEKAAKDLEAAAEEVAKPTEAKSDEIAL